MRGTRYITGTITGTTAGPASSTGVPTWTVTIDAIAGADGSVALPTDGNALCNDRLHEGYQSAGLVSVLVEDDRILYFTSLVKGGAAARRGYLVTVGVAEHDADLLERGIPEALHSRLAGTAARVLGITPVPEHGSGDDDEHFLARKLAAQAKASADEA